MKLNQLNRVTKYAVVITVNDYYIVKYTVNGKVYTLTDSLGKTKYFWEYTDAVNAGENIIGTIKNSYNLLLIGTLICLIGLVTFLLISLI